MWPKALQVGVAALSSLIFTGVVLADNDKADSKDKKSDLTVYLREAKQTITVLPGQTAGVASVCQDGEVVVGGGPTGIPASLTVLYSTLFYDGHGSGWQVVFRNGNTNPVTETAAVSAICVRGKIVPSTIILPKI